ncbi:MAG: ABC transporter ATP-binding protein [Firmicutes bacterium]|nr:ABC transporter ATP-binding protein [Bacillota bacterium]
MNILEVEGLTKKYDNFTAVKKIDFTVAEGEIFGFLGPNGAGKTTTINMLCGLASITGGTARLDGLDYRRSLPAIKSQIGIVPDESNLYEELDGFDNLNFCASLYGLGKQERGERAARLLKLFGLTDAGGKRYKHYSKGMKRKLTIAAALIHEPRMLFLDEPTTGIDVASARQIRQMIQELNDAGTTVFLTTHYIEEAERLCHRIAFIVGGEIVRCGSLKELMKTMQQGTEIQFTLSGGETGPGKDFKEHFPDYSVDESKKGEVRIRAAGEISLYPLVNYFEERGRRVYEARVIRPSLEDVFVRITGLDLEKMKQEKGGRRG